jgi:hypothetical protein
VCLASAFARPTARQVARTEGGAKRRKILARQDVDKTVEASGEAVLQESPAAAHTRQPKDAASLLNARSTTAGFSTTTPERPDYGDRPQQHTLPGVGPRLAVCGISPPAGLTKTTVNST